MGSQRCSKTCLWCLDVMQTKLNNSKALIFSWWASSCSRLPFSKIRWSPMYGGLCWNQWRAPTKQWMISRIGANDWISVTNVLTLSTVAGWNDSVPTVAKRHSSNSHGTCLLIVRIIMNCGWNLVDCMNGELNRMKLGCAMITFNNSVLIPPLAMSS